MFDQRSYQLFEELLKHDKITKKEILLQLDISERQLVYDLEKINSVLSNNDLPTISVSNQIIIVNPKLREIKKTNDLVFHSNSFIISELDRSYLIYLYTFIRQEPVSNYHFQLLLDVSKNTALSDVKRLKEICSDWQVEFVYSRMDGYHLQGDEFDKRRLAIYSVNYLLSQPLGKEIIVLALRSWDMAEMLVKTKEMVETYLKTTDIELVKSRKNEMIIHLTLLRVRTHKGPLHFTNLEKQILEEQAIFTHGKELAGRLFSGECEDEIYFVTILLLITLEIVGEESNTELQVLAEQIIEEFEKNTLLPIENKVFLKKSLYNHLVPAFFRIKFGIPLFNPLTERIKNEYTELFHFVKRSLSPFRLWTGKKICDEEIGFFTMHFGGILGSGGEWKEEKITGLIICANGLSSSIMLEAQLKELFPNIEFHRIRNSKAFQDIPATNYDVVFSTVDVKSFKPVFIVKPLLSEVEKVHLVRRVFQHFPRMNNMNLDVDQLLDIIKKHADVKDENKLLSEIVNLFYAENKSKGLEKPMLSELLTEEMIHFTSKNLNWRDAIEKTAEPLIQSNKIQQNYVDAMIENVEKNGTYIHVGKGIAIPHARPEAGVNQLGMSFLRTKTPVLLLDEEDYPIDIFICLAAIDNEAHLKALAQLTKILGNDELLSELKAAESAEQIMDIIKKGENA